MPYDDSMPERDFIRIPSCLDQIKRSTFESNAMAKYDRHGQRFNSTASMMKLEVTNTGEAYHCDQDWEPDLDDLVVIGQDVLSKEVAYARSIPANQRVLIYKTEKESF